MNPLLILLLKFYLTYFNYLNISLNKKEELNKMGNEGSNQKSPNRSNFPILSKKNNTISYSENKKLQRDENQNNSFNAKLSGISGEQRQENEEIDNCVSRFNFQKNVNFDYFTL